MTDDLRTKAAEQMRQELRETADYYAKRYNWRPTDQLQRTAEQRLQRLRYLATVLESGHPTASELMEIAQVLRQLLEEVERA